MYIYLYSMYICIYNIYVYIHIICMYIYIYLSLTRIYIYIYIYAQMHTHMGIDAKVLVKSHDCTNRSYHVFEPSGQFLSKFAKVTCCFAQVILIQRKVDMTLANVLP